MRRLSRALSIAALWAAGTAVSAGAQTPPAPTPTPGTPPAAAPAAPPPPLAATPGGAPTPSPTEITLPTPTPIAPDALKIRDVPSIAVERLPAENPFGKTVDAPAGLPQKLVFNDATLPASFFVTVHLDPTGHPLSIRRDHDPIPSLAAESLKSISRWTFAPGRRGGQPVETWAPYRIELSVELRSPRLAQTTLTPIEPSTPIPKPFEWPPDSEWLDARHVSAPTDGTVPIDQVDTAPIPQKTPWSADSYKGPFSVKLWVKVDASYVRRSMSAWTLRPAQAGGAAVDTWNELTLGGTISYSDDIKQIVALRKDIGTQTLSGPLRGPTDERGRVADPPSSSSR
jgi:hypothetical protein